MDPKRSTKRCSTCSRVKPLPEFDGALPPSSSYPPPMTGSYLQIKPPASTAVLENENPLSKRKFDG